MNKTKIRFGLKDNERDPRREETIQANIHMKNFKEVSKNKTKRIKLIEQFMRISTYRFVHNREVRYFEGALYESLTDMVNVPVQPASNMLPLILVTKCKILTLVLDMIVGNDVLVMMVNRQFHWFVSISPIFEQSLNRKSCTDKCSATAYSA